MNTNDPELPLSYAPWTPEQVSNLNDYQACASFHPMTCGNDTPRCRTVLTASARALWCPACGWRQDWAHRFMAEGVWRLAVGELDRIRRAAE